MGGWKGVGEVEVGYTAGARPGSSTGLGARAAPSAPNPTPRPLQPSRPHAPSAPSLRCSASSLETALLCCPRSQLRALTGCLVTGSSSTRAKLMLGSASKCLKANSAFCGGEQMRGGRRGWVGGWLACGMRTAGRAAGLGARSTARRCATTVPLAIIEARGGSEGGRAQGLIPHTLIIFLGKAPLTSIISFSISLLVWPGRGRGGWEHR